MNFDHPLYKKLEDLAQEEWENLPKEAKERFSGACVMHTITQTPTFWFKFINNEQKQLEEDLFKKVESQFLEVKSSNELPCMIEHKIGYNQGIRDALKIIKPKN